MKKFFIALSVLAALMLSVVPSQALIGMPDDTAGTDAVVPFICDISGTTGLNTLIMFADTGLNDGINFHYTMYTVRSDTVYDDFIYGTKGDIVATDAFNEVAKTAPAIRSQLEVDLDGDGVNDHYAGYIYYSFVKTAANNYNSVVGQFFLVELSRGIAASCNIAMKEYKDDLPGNFQGPMAPNGIEVFTPNAAAGAIGLQDGNLLHREATSFGLYQRYYIMNEGGSTWLLYWFSENDILGTIHTDFWDADENWASTNIPLINEFSIIDVEQYLPESLHPMTVYPKEGWIDLYWSSTPLPGWPLLTDAVRNLEMLGWTYLQAYGSASESWTVLNPHWRSDVTY